MCKEMVWPLWGHLMSSVRSRRDDVALEQLPQRPWCSTLGERRGASWPYCQGRICNHFPRKTNGGLTEEKTSRFWLVFECCRCWRHLLGISLQSDEVCQLPAGTGRFVEWLFPFAFSAANSSDPLLDVLPSSVHPQSWFATEATRHCAEFARLMAAASHGRGMFLSTVSC